MAIAFFFTSLALIVVFGVYFWKQNRVNKSRELTRLYGKLVEINKLSPQGIDNLRDQKTRAQEQKIKSRIENITGVEPDSADFVKVTDSKFRNYAKECEEMISQLLRGSPQ